MKAHIFDGAGSQISTSNRWGDYSDMTVDPVDDSRPSGIRQSTTTPSSSFNWRTQIASFKLASAVDTVTITKAQYSISASQLNVHGDRLQPGRGLDCQGDEFG